MCTCDRARELINEKIDRCIAKEDDAVLFSHLSECDECRGIYEAYSRIQAGLLELEEEPAENFAGQVMFRVMGEKQKKKRRFPVGIAATVACAAALALVIGFGGVTDLLGARAESASFLTNGSSASNTGAADDAAYSVEIADSSSYSSADMDAGYDSYFLDEADDADGAESADESEERESVSAGGTARKPEFAEYAAILRVKRAEDLGEQGKKLTFIEYEGGLYSEVTLDELNAIYAENDASSSLELEVLNENAEGTAVAVILILS